MYNSNKIKGSKININITFCSLIAIALNSPTTCYSKSQPHTEKQLVISTESPVFIWRIVSLLGRRPSLHPSQTPFKTSGWFFCEWGKGGEGCYFVFVFHFSLYSFSSAQSDCLWLWSQLIPGRHFPSVRASCHVPRHPDARSDTIEANKQNTGHVTEREREIPPSLPTASPRRRRSSRHGTVSTTQHVCQPWEDMWHGVHVHLLTFQLAHILLTLCPPMRIIFKNHKTVSCIPQLCFSISVLNVTPLSPVSVCTWQTATWTPQSYLNISRSYELRKGREKGP